MNKTFFAGGTFWYGVGIIGSLFFGKAMLLTCCWGLLLMFIGTRENEGKNKDRNNFTVTGKPSNSRKESIGGEKDQ